jgi:hypothetical protein
MLVLQLLLQMLVVLEALPLQLQLEQLVQPLMLVLLELR